MTQILIYGRKGSGKTLRAVRHAYDAFNEGRTVYSNIKLNFPHKPLTQEMISGIMQQDCLTEAFILLDELHIIADSRRSMAKRNIDWGYFFTQSRKRGVDIESVLKRAFVKNSHNAISGPSGRSIPE